MQNELKKRIMRRVYGIWFIRKAWPLVTETAGVFLLGFWGLQYVSPVSVLKNAIAAADGFQAFFVFFIRSFEILPPASQFAMVAGGMLVAVILRDILLQTSHLGRIRNIFPTDA